MDKALIEYGASCGIFFQHRLLDRDYTVKFSSHTHYELLYLIKGRIELMIDGAHYIVNAGEMILIDVNVLHSQRMFEGVETELMVVTFSPDILPHYIKLTFFRVVSDRPTLKNILPSSICKKYKFFSFFKTINTLAGKKDLPYKEYLICAEIIKLVTSINRAVDEIVGVDNSQVLKKGFILEDCLDFINSNISKKLTIEEIASSMFISKSYLQHVFKAKMGMAISDYITSQKMTLAKSLLERGYRPTEVAERLGYDYYPTFRVKYKKFYNITPNKVGGGGRFLLDFDMDKKRKEEKV